MIQITDTLHEDSARGNYECRVVVVIFVETWYCYYDNNIKVVVQMR
jgi:hypothetical protein